MRRYNTMLYDKTNVFTLREHLQVFGDVSEIAHVERKRLFYHITVCFNALFQIIISWWRILFLLLLLLLFYLLLLTNAMHWNLHVYFSIKIQYFSSIFLMSSCLGLYQSSPRVSQLFGVREAKPVQLLQLRGQIAAYCRFRITDSKWTVKRDLHDK